VLTVLALEDDGLTSLNADHRNVAKLDSVVDAHVELQEGAARTCHVIRHVSIHHPPGGVDLRIFITKLCKNSPPRDERDLTALVEPSETRPLPPPDAA
jgi:hypothetical protein